MRTRAAVLGAIGASAPYATSMQIGSRGQVRLSLFQTPQLGNFPCLWAS